MEMDHWIEFAILVLSAEEVAQAHDRWFLWRECDKREIF